MTDKKTLTAFRGSRLLASGPMEQVLRALKLNVGQMKSGLRRVDEAVLVFDDETGKQVDFDLRGSIEDVFQRAIPKSSRAGPGRPRLGVVSREVSLLPKHWEWLEAQPNGASAALRRLVETASKRRSSENEIRTRIEALGRVMTVLAGNFPRFEEAYRALYARNLERLRQQVKGWPAAVRNYILAGATSVLAEHSKAKSSPISSQES